MTSTHFFSTSINFKKGFATLLTALCITVLIWLLFIKKDRSNQVQVVATVNSEPITRSEMRHFMLLNKAEIYNYFYRTYDASYSEGFWDKIFNGVKPENMLKERSLDDAVSYKVQQILAKEKGMPVITNFDSLMYEQEKVNEIRKRKVEDGQVVYGPVNLSARNYVKKVRDEMVQGTKNVLSKNNFKISNEKLKRLYKKYRAQQESINIDRDDKKISSFEAFKAVRQNQYTNKQYAKLIEALSAKAEVKINTQVYNKINLQ